MVRSMTGFGRFEATSENITVQAEIKSVNHRYFEFSMRSPRNCQFLEDTVKKAVQSKVSRGKAELSLNVTLGEGSSTSVTVNKEYVDAYIEALKTLSKTYKLKNDMKLSALASNPDVFSVSKTEVDEEVLTKTVLDAVNGAVDMFIAMRETEGDKLKEDVLSRCLFLENCVSFVEKRSPETVKEYSEKLKANVEELLGGHTVDEQRLLTEVAIMADKLAVAEETVRLRSHIAQLRTMFESDEPIGRKLDFLVQEMNRETNTIGSKAQDLEIARTVVDMKAEIEKIREQIQNIE